MSDAADGTARLHVPDSVSWSAVTGRVRDLVGEAFADDGPANLIDGEWRAVGTPSEQTSPVDGSSLGTMLKVDAATASDAVQRAAATHRSWGDVDLDERRRRVSASLDAMESARDDLALLLAWEIGKPWAMACADVDRCISGVRWYVEEIEGMLSRDVEGAPAKRAPLDGPGLEHRELELPDERAGARRAGAAAGRQRRRREDAHPGRLDDADRRPRAHGPRGAARDAAGRRRLGALGRADPLARDRGARVRRRAVQRRPGRRAARRHRQAAHARAGGPQHLGHLGVLRLGDVLGDPQEGLRVRQAALHRLPALRRAAQARRPVPRDVPAGARGCPLRAPARGRGGPRRGRRPARPRLRPADLRGEGRRARRERRGGPAPRGRAALPRRQGGRALPARPGHLRLPRPGLDARPSRARRG